VIKKLNILIAEHDSISELLFLILLEKFASKIFTVKTGVEAVNALRNNPEIDLIFMGIRMPEMDGYEATKQIRILNTNVIIVAQTAMALDEVHDKAIDAGCDDFITKPITENVIMMLLEKYFGRELIQGNV